jgi:hypothetical protein
VQIDDERNDHRHAGMEFQACCRERDAYLPSLALEGGPAKRVWGQFAFAPSR